MEGDKERLLAQLEVKEAEIERLRFVLREVVEAHDGGSGDLDEALDHAVAILADGDH